MEEGEILSDEELKGYFRTWTDGDIDRMKMLKMAQNPFNSKRQAELFKEDVYRRYDAEPQRKFKILADLRPVEKNHYVSPEAKEIYVYVMQHEQLGKMAFLVTGWWMRQITGVMIHFSSRWSKVRWFNNEEKAIKWLRAD